MMMRELETEMRTRTFIPFLSEVSLISLISLSKNMHSPVAWHYYRQQLDNNDSHFKLIAPFICPGGYNVVEG